MTFDGDRLPSRAPDGLRMAAVLPWLAVGVSFALGVAGLLALGLDLDLVYGQPWLVALPAWACAALVLGALGIAARWGALRRPTPMDSRHSERQILLASIVFVGLAAAGAAVVGFAAQQRTRLEATNAALSAAIDARTRLLDEVLEAGSRRALHASQRMPPLPPPSQAANHAATQAAKVQIALFARSLVDTGYAGVVVTTADGSPIVSVGDVAAARGLQARLAHGVHSQLLWDDGLVLRQQVQAGDADGTVRRVQLDQRLDALWRDFFTATGFGTTGEVRLCVRADAGLRCIAGPPERTPVEMPAAGAANAPMLSALAGSHGVARFNINRGTPTLAAYGPLGPDVGVVVQQAAVEAFAPARRTLAWSLPLLGLLVLAAVFGVWAQVKPLAARLGAAQREAARNETQIRSVMDSVAEGILTISEDWVITSANRAACEMFGYSAQEMVGRDIVDLVPERLRGAHRAAIELYRQTGDSKVVGQRCVELAARAKNGREFQVEFTIGVMALDAEAVFTGVVRDITARKQAERRLFAEKELLRVTLGAIGDGVIAVDRSARVTYLNRVAEAMTGWQGDEAVGRPVQDVLRLCDSTSRARTQDPVEQVLRSGQATSREQDVLLVSRDGAERPLEDAAAPIFDDHGQVAGAVVVLHDVTRARKLAAELSHQATHDPLTGLLNRSAFEQRLDTVLQSPGGSGQTHGLLFLDLDQFKVVNDTCGHAAGDLLLRQLAQLLRGALRRGDTIARLGGDEFAVLLNDCPASAAAQVAENLRQQVQDFAFSWEARHFHVGASIGLVSFVPGEFDRAGVLRAADSACYVAKEKGRNRVHAFHANDVDLQRRAGEMDWVSRLQQALAEDRFVLYAQPIVGLDALPGATPRFEILLRLLDEQGRMVPPMAFIPAAERYGLMGDIDRWVIRHALAEHRRHRAAVGCPVHYSINLSGSSLSDDTLGAYVQAELLTNDTPRGEICFEVTETAAVANLEVAVDLLGALRAQGCQVALDDFGAGMSSFNYLKRLPLDYLKIDGGLVRRIGDDLTHRAMVEAIHKIGHLMALKTVAEFVEDQRILDELRSVGVDFVQGYAIAKPGPLCDAFSARAVDPVAAG
ncbi:EAL domain-containing protein [Ideonella sp. BN130291]|uniref:EAL domain-containing protein n=1 Tax=Ideonella sp. BN130291 TaxID=3112940 RepID=UPI002E2758BB|nr:EAL domain-containing protein [Ideonella sp. BN130291]